VAVDDPAAVEGAVKRRSEVVKRLTYSIMIAGAMLFAAPGTDVKRFSSAEKARDALIEAAAQGLHAVKALFGPSSAEILRTGDEVADKNVLIRFNTLAQEKVQLEPDEMNPNRMTLVVGLVEWPFAVPLVRRNGQWFWDIEEGKAEIRRRTIGGNELTAIEICRGYVEAQTAYAETDRNGNGVLEYASKIISTQGRKDGLYWSGEDSPVAAGFAKAVAEGYKQGAAPRPYHGYFYKILRTQGPDAVGGAQDYFVHGLMIGGFALVAWPAEYGVSGIMTFIVSHGGIVYEKDLGAHSGALARAMTRFNPDKSWRAVPEEVLPEEEPGVVRSSSTR
jgi:hypothetical protein